MLRAIAAAKKKNDRIDASRICDRLRRDFCRSATWSRPRFASGAARCVIAMTQPVDRIRRLVEHSRRRQNQLGDMCALTRFRGREACLGKLHEMQFNELALRGSFDSFHSLPCDAGMWQR